MTDTKESESISHEEIIAAIKAATAEVFSTMLSMEVPSDEILTPQAAGAGPASGIIALIGFAGPWAGTGSLACTAELACKLSSQFLMAPYEAVNDDVLDAVAEITNMILGNVKTTIEQKVGSMGLSTPTVIFGRNFQTRSARTHEWTGVRFACGEEKLDIQVCLAQNPDPGGQKTLRPGFQFPQMLHI
jgi:chemotaxis protein CheX